MNHLVNHIVECCNRLGINHEATFRRNVSGNLERKHEDYINRWAACYLARAWQNKVGAYSYPEITEACQMKGHSTVIDGVQRMVYLIEMVRRVDAAMKLLKKQGHAVVPPTPKGPPK